jgi:hypothetical protein
MVISALAVYNCIIHKEVQMLSQSTAQIIQWQDFKLPSEADLVLNLGQQNGWKDCKIFGRGAMITQPLESMGWKLIPADLYEYSIPVEGVNRILQIINSGVHIQGVIIADDQRNKKSTTAPATPLKPQVSSKTSSDMIGKVLLGFVFIAMLIVIGSFALIGTVLIAPMLLMGIATNYDPELVILVDDGNEGLAWISIFTWYD